MNNSTSFFFTTILLFLGSSLVFSQESGLSGRILDQTTGQGVAGAVITIAGQTGETTSAADGTFQWVPTPSDQFQISFAHPDFTTQTLTLKGSANQWLDLGDIYMQPRALVYEDIPTIDIQSEEELGDIADQNIIGLLGASQDIYISESAFKFGAVRFSVRGLQNSYTQTYINGVNFNDQVRGQFNYSMLGGLNDAVRNKDFTGATGASRYGFGDLGGLSHINTRATSYNPGGKATASYTNRSYSLRGMATYSTGLMKNKLAVTGSVGYRYADEGFVDGTFYDSFGYFLSVEKLLGARDQHSISLTTLGSPTQRGQQGASYQEIYDLVDNNLYNPNWGYQNGTKRNARVVTSYDPVTVLSHHWLINQNTQLTSGIGYRYNQYGTTALNWYNSADPRPDYYRYLPSYQGTDEMKELYRQAWKNDPSVSQVNWDRLYMVNYERDRALYMVEERHYDLREINFNSILRNRISDRQTLTAGVEFHTTKSLNNKTVNDLLGARYWLDVDQFADRDFRGDENIKQNDLDNPNRTVTKGDTFGYDYDLYINSGHVWIQNEFTLPKVDFYYATKLSYTNFYRYGNMRNGRAPDNSYGKGKQHEFTNYALKAGGLYKITGRHMLSANAIYQTKAPLPRDAYLSARTKDDAIPELKSERVAAGDISYLISTPGINGRITAFQSNFYDQNELTSFYHDSYRTFVNYVMAGIRKVYRGFELGLSVNLTPELSLKAVGTLAEYLYKNRPLGYITYENGSRPDTTETVYLKNFYVGGTPQTAGSLGLNYAHPAYWFFEVNFNYFDRNYVDLTPVRRTPSAVDFQAYNQEERDKKVEEIVEQEKYGAGGTLDVSIGKSLRLSGGKFLSLNLNANNILNNTSLKSGGYEQGRFDFDNYDVNKFPSKYYYAQGFNFFFNVGLRF